MGNAEKAPSGCNDQKQLGTSTRTVVYSIAYSGEAEKFSQDSFINRLIQNFVSNDFKSGHATPGESAKIILVNKDYDVMIDNGNVCARFAVSSKFGDFEVQVMPKAGDGIINIESACEISPDLKNFINEIVENTESVNEPISENTYSIQSDDENTFDMLLRLNDTEFDTFAELVSNGGFSDAIKSSLEKAGFKEEKFQGEPVASPAFSFLAFSLGNDKYECIISIDSKNEELRLEIIGNQYKSMQIIDCVKEATQRLRRYIEYDFSAGTNTMDDLCKIMKR